MKTTFGIGPISFKEDENRFNLDMIIDGKVEQLVHIDFATTWPKKPFTMEEKKTILEPFLKSYMDLLKKKEILME